MDDVQSELAGKGIAECARVTARGLDTDKDFAVLECKHVSGSQLSEKLPMQNRHPCIGNKPHENFSRFMQVSSFLLSQSQAMLHGIRCKSLEVGNIHRKSSLNVSHADAPGFGASIHFVCVDTRSFFAPD